MESPKKRILRLKSRNKLFPKSKVSTAPTKSLTTIAPMPAILNQPKQRNPLNMKSRKEDRTSLFAESAANIETSNIINFRRRNPSSSTKSASEALLALRNSALIFSERQKNSQKKRDETVSPFLNLPKSMDNTEISNVTNIRHILSSPNIKRKSNSDTECEKIEDPELSYPLPSKRPKRPKSADSQINVEDFLLAKEIKAKRNDYQAKIDKLKAQNDEIQAKSEDLKAKMVDFKAKAKILRNFWQCWNVHLVKSYPKMTSQDQMFMDAQMVI